MSTTKVEIYDTTLRDGAQAEGISYSLEDKIEIAIKLDKLGIHYIEGGWPLSNPKDEEFFKRIKKENLKFSKISAFGSTRKATNIAEKDPNLLKLLEADTSVVTLFGKSWDLHVKEALRVSFDENLKMIEDSIKFMKKEGKIVIYDAEHFFDGFLSNPEYALKTLVVAQESGADTIVLCDTNGGRLPHEIEEIIKKVKEKITVPLGIHAHNDSGTAVASTIIAVRNGVVHVQGTMNGYGERCGNADLCVVIPNLQLKLGINVLPEENIKRLTEVSRFIYGITNQIPPNNQPFVGVSAFAHKGGIHVSAVRRNYRTYEHIDPEKIGNERKILISELSGRSNILAKTRYNLKEDPEKMKEILEKIQEMEKEGYQFESAEASFELLVRKIVGDYKKFFELHGYRVMVENRDDGKLISEATIKVIVHGRFIHTASEGNGPVDALSNALLKALTPVYPELEEIKLIDFKVRIIDSKAGTKARTRVCIETRDRTEVWTTVGVSGNIIEASWIALVDSIEYKLLKGRA